MDWWFAGSIFLLGLVHQLRPGSRIHGSDDEQTGKIISGEWRDYIISKEFNSGPAGVS
jgi:hypothetical protein